LVSTDVFAKNKMGKLFSTFLAVFLHLSVSAINEYPAWFLYPENFPGVYTGFSYNGYPALADAEMMYCVYQEVTVDGYLETIEIENNKYYKNSNYYYIYPKELIDSIKGKLQYLDGFCNDVLTESYVSAFCLDTSNTRISKKRINISNHSAPFWIKSDSWKDDSYYYGVGMFTSRGNDNDAWKTSEEKAIFSILTSLSIKIFSVNRSEVLNLNNNTYEKHINYIRVNLEYKIHGIEVLERWPDLKNDYFYTLVRIKKNNIDALFDK